MSKLHRLGIFPGTPSYSNEGQIPTIRAWFGHGLSGRLCAQELPELQYWFVKWLTGWDRPCIAYEYPLFQPSGGQPGGDELTGLVTPASFQEN
jgi:hypothetical protein